MNESLPRDERLAWSIPPQAEAVCSDWLAGLARTHRLTDLATRRIKDADACRVIVATATGVYALQGRVLQPARLSGLSALDSGDCYASLVTAPSGAMACVSTHGRFVLIDADGVLIRMRKVADYAWHITHAQWNGQTCFFITGLYGTIHVLDASGDQIACLRAPGPMLSLDAQMIQGDLWLAGGARDRRQVYLWNLSHIVSGHAEPPIVLRGGRKPAYMTRFVNLDDQWWLAHSCWDGCVYLYPQPWRARGVLAPTLTLCDSSPLYAIEPVVIQNRLYLFAGAEDGRLLAWALNGEHVDASPAFEVARLSARIKCLAGARVADQPTLYAGCADGRLAVFSLPRAVPELPVQRVSVGGGPICGIGFAWPMDD